MLLSVARFIELFLCFSLTFAELPLKVVLNYLPGSSKIFLSLWLLTGNDVALMVFYIY
jgi:hypothetical protein